jgi:hypothetical protein
MCVASQTYANKALWTYANKALCERDSVERNHAYRGLIGFAVKTMNFSDWDGLSGLAMIEICGFPPSR